MQLARHTQVSKTQAHTRAHQVQIQLASDLASWTAKCKVLEEAGSNDKPKGKPGNVITRMYARTGWWPLKRESPNWEKEISQFGITPNTVNTSTAEMTKELGPEVLMHAHNDSPSTHSSVTHHHNAQVRIRQCVLEAFRGSWLCKSENLKKEYDSKSARRKTSVPNTVFGKGMHTHITTHTWYHTWYRTWYHTPTPPYLSIGFCVEEDLVVVKANDERIAQKDEEKVRMCMYV